MLSAFVVWKWKTHGCAVLAMGWNMFYPFRAVERGKFKGERIKSWVMSYD
jgi:hypothetical protein